MIERQCPLCHSPNHKTELNLRANDFVRNNPSYRTERVAELEFEDSAEFPIVSCTDCGMTYTRYSLEPEKEAVVYTRIIDSEKSFKKVQSLGRKTADLNRCLSLLKLAQSQKKGFVPRILDYGCGWGTLLRTASGLGIEATGYDVTPWKVEWARKNGLEILTSEDDLMKQGPFDLCVSTSVLEHIADPHHAIETIASRMVPGGHCYLTCIIPEVARPLGWTKIRSRFKLGQSFAKEINPWEHLNYFTPGSLARLMQQHDFYPVRAPGTWVDDERILKTSAKSIVKHYLPLQWTSLWVSDFWQYRPQAS